MSRRPWAWALLPLLLTGCAEPARPSRPAAPPARAASVPARAAAVPAAPGPVAATAGEVEAEPATFHSLGVRWPIRGDANADATVHVGYRRRGEVEWRPAWPLFRPHPSRLSPELRVAEGWLFAGSIVDLAPGTAYEVALSLRDPDGGDADRVLELSTRPEPQAPADLRVRHVVPGEGEGTGTPLDPIRGLRAAQAVAEPGDLFLLHAGVYTVPGWTIDRQGIEGRPIVYRAAGDGDVVLDGGGAERLVSAPGVRHVWFEGLTFRNARYLFVGHRGGETVIRRSVFDVTRVGIAAINGGYDVSRGFVITDNVFRGPVTWPRSRGIEAIHGVSVTGAGHVVAYNRFEGLGDGVHGTSHGRLSASDFHNNDIDVCTDDGIEADYADTNVRIFENRITNCFAAVSAQPVHGGPLYVFRNAIYNVLYSPIKLHNHTAGILFLHNTSVTAGIPFLIQPGSETVSDVVTRNNLFIGIRGPALHSSGRMIRCDFDRDGYGWPGRPFALWNKRTYPSAAAAQRSGALYARHGAVVVDAARTFASGLRPPPDPRVRYAPADADPRLRPDAAAVDAGVPLPNLNDGFAGSAPDLGCCELGRPLPQYGPRPAASGS